MAAPSINKNIWAMWETASGNKRSWLFSTQADGTFRTIFSWDGSSFSLHKTHTAIFDNSWINLIVSFASGVQTVYVNTVSQTMDQTIAWGGGVAGLNAANVSHSIGTIDPSAPPIDNSPQMCFSNFSIWSKVLTAGERTELYNSGVPKSLATHSAVANLTNWLRLDQTDAPPTLTDTQAAGANMTITTSGTNSRFAQTTQVPNFSSDPGVANVASGTTYVINGTSLTGTNVGSNGAHYI